MVDFEVPRVEPERPVVSSSDLPGAAGLPGTMRRYLIHSQEHVSRLTCWRLKQLDAASVHRGGVGGKVVAGGRDGGWVGEAVGTPTDTHTQPSLLK